MLHKIIYKNFKSNIRKYILFFVSNIIAVAELFIFWGLNDVVVRAVTEPSIMMGIKSDFMIAVGLITVVTILLMVFSMRYYIKLRAKDYGTFIMLGMKKKMSYMLLFAEYIIGCIGSLLIGILLGNLLLYGILYCLNQYNPQIITLQKVDPVVYKNTILLCLGVMLGIFIILLVWMDGRNLSSLMMKEEIKEKRPVSSKWLLFTVLGIVFIILAIKQYKPGTWGYYFAHIYFLIGGILIITFSGAFILEQAKKEPFYFRYALKINQFDSKYQSNILIILMLFVIHFFALSYIGTQIVEILPLDKTNSNYPYDIIWMARQNDEKYSEKIAEKYNLRAGMGMAFVQMGHLKRIFVIANELEEKGTFEEYVIINPKIISQSEELIYVGEGEGCLSVNREVEGIVPRHARITVEYYDYEGNKKTMRAREDLAVAFQHEIDHLNGILFTDKIDSKDPYKDANKMREI